jgi:concanavalin A-like lectin/glucanase superfamily protein
VRPGQRRFSRRALLVGAAGASAYGVFRLADLDSEAPRPGGVPSPAPGPTYDGPGEIVDLTVRWRHLETRAAAPDLLAGWTFDETAGYSFGDVSGNGHRLYATGTRWNTTDSGLAGALHRRGLRGGAVWLDGSRWLAADLAPGLAGTTGLTVSCRIRAARLPTGPATLVGYGAAYRLVLDATGALSLLVTDTEGQVHALRTAKAVIAPDRWTHVSATITPAAGVLTLFLDGNETATVESVPFLMPETPQRLMVGSRLTGAIDELTLHAQPLTADAVRQLFVVGLPAVFTQTSESLDANLRVFNRFSGSDPVPHPAEPGSVLLHRFAGSTTTEQGVAPFGLVGAAEFVPGVFGGAWRATSQRLSYPSPLEGDSGSFEAWYRAISDPADPHRVQRKEVFHAVGPSAALTLFTRDGRWCVEVRRPAAPTDTGTGPSQTFVPGTLEHVAVTWGQQAGGRHGVALYVNGAPAAFLPTRPGGTTFTQRVGLGGTASAPAYCLFDDVRISDTALAWGDVCPRGQAATGAAGLDLRDRFDRPRGAAPMLWRAGTAGGAWSHQEMSWQRPDAVGDDPASRRALFQGTRSGRHPAYHPDAYGQASSIEAGVAFGSAVDGWAGMFIHSPQVGGDFSGLTFMMNPAQGLLRLARFEAGRVTAAKALPYDFPMAARTTYEMTLTNAGDGIVRGFIDGSNVISLRTEPDWLAQGYAGMLTDGAAAFFSNLHFCALTPVAEASRAIRMREIRYGDGADVAAVALVPFQWHKRPGLLPWQYTHKRPEPPGTIAGADTVFPVRPIGPAAWRAEDSANSDVITLGGQVLYFMRGNPRVDDRAGAARIGVLYGDVTAFDGIHFTDPNAALGNLTGGTLLVGEVVPDAPILPTGEPAIRQLNAPSTAYVGNGQVLFLARDFSHASGARPPYDSVVFSRFDVTTGRWEHSVPRHLPWGEQPASEPATTAGSGAGPSATGPAGTVGAGEVGTSRPGRPPIHGSPEVLSLRDPDLDAYQAVVFQQTGSPDAAVMATAMLANVTAGIPALAPGMPVHTSLSRPSGKAIYGFRVMFDNGIYYLHYNEGPVVPDWPDRFVLAAALDPYAGPWIASPTTLPEDSTYFRRGSEFEPDNGAIWQGTMFKHRGRYYHYYECYHSLDDVDAPYENYSEPQAGSRVGFATA